MLDEGEYEGFVHPNGRVAVLLDEDGNKPCHLAKGSHLDRQRSISIALLGL